jgi:uncharacterized protein HemX
MEPQPKHSHRKYWIIIVLLLLVAIGSGAGVYLWQQQEIQSLNKTESNKLLQVNKLEKQISNLKIAKTKVDSSVEKLSETDEQKIQRTATAYLHRFAKASQTDMPSFTTKEKTIVNSGFAIQYYCGPGECSQMWLKKVGATWIVLNSGIELDNETIKTLNSDYGWPLGFKS